ncbi:AAA family ATPase, partial [Candidatus Woesearchaeota archaeon]|nr:AAA family ATPase [Candidatus Woesearchaeota archaeon]
KTRNMPDLIEYGASPRASLGIIMAAKAKALIDGRKYVSIKDVEQMAYPVLRHRLILSFKAEREGMNPDQVVAEVIKKA